MATRSRTGSPRTPKASARAQPAAGAPPNQSTQPGPARAPRTDTLTGAQPQSPAEVTAANLERREIPSFSLSREARIAEAAYWRAERRGFAAGSELDDWLEAEREIDRQIESEGSRPGPR